MNFLSVCSGIEAASVAWNPLGWKAWALAEIEPFPCAVLAHHYPDTPNLGDMTNFKEWPDGAIDLLCGGTPCQSFSVAGLRKGLDDPRGNLMLTFGAIAARYRPRWLVWENVPGVLSSNGGRDFGSFLGLLGFIGYRFAYRVLDAQYFGLAQRRKRVFVVGCLGGWRSAAAVLFERSSLSWNPAPSRETRQGVAAGTLRRTQGGSDVDHPRAGHIVATIDASFGRLQGASGQDANHGHSHLISMCLNAKRGAGRLDAESETLIPIIGGDFDVANTLHRHHGQPQLDQMLVPIPFDTTRITSATNRSQPGPGDPCRPLARGAHAPAIAFDARQSDVIQYGEKTGPLDTDAYTMGIQTGTRVRRLTPRECERLQGFSDDYTLVPLLLKPRQTRVRWAADGPRYKALGNSWAVPCAAWIGRRIASVDALPNPLQPQPDPASEENT